MTLVSGSRLGPYEILAPLGAGGMGEVYRARDTRLDRSVAVKVLPSHLTSNPDLRARFEREAKAVSSLNHPHICTLHDVGQHEGTDYLVMELVEGETLADRLKKGALPLEQTLRIAIEIADALDKAHRQGVIHRDLKPGNVMLTKAGSKLMDFGLAKLTMGGESAGSVSALPTASAPLTGQGAILGTVPYMAPEQLEGKEADARSDLWAFGCLLYEMATGRRAFEGKSQASLISAIMDKEPPPISQLQPLTPPSLQRLVKVCLAKDPDDRFQIAHDVMQEMKWIAETPSGAAAMGGGSGAIVEPGHGHWSSTALAIAVLFGLLAGALLGRSLLAPASTRPQVVHSLLDVRPADALRGPSSQEIRYGGGRPSLTAIALSPDGQRLAFAARAGDRQRLYLRVLGETEAKPLPGTEGAEGAFFSPDGRSLGFWADGAIRKMPLDGSGPPVELCNLPAFAGASWGPDDSIVFAGPVGGLQRVSSSGGKPQPLTTLAAYEVSHRLPHIMPDGRAVLFTSFESRFDTRTARVEVVDLRSGERRVVAENATDARYVQPGYVLFARRGKLMALPFDPGTLQKTGGEFGVLDDVMQALNAGITNVETGAAQFTLSSSGTLAYVVGGLIPSQERRLVWVSRSGAVRALDAPAHPYIGPRLSPDGRRVAVYTREDLTRVLWVHDLTRGTLTRPVPESEGAMLFPRWTPNGQQLAFRWDRKGEGDLFLVDADGGTSPERLTRTKASVGDPSLWPYPSSWHPDGRNLVYLQGNDIWLLTKDAAAWSSRALMETKAAERFAELSPDGRWLAYESDETGRTEVYVRGFPDMRGRVQVSSEGGSSPLWSRNGRELFYLRVTNPTRFGDLTAVDVRLGPELWIGTPRVLFSLDERRLYTTSPVTTFDVSADGLGFLFAQNTEVTPPPPVAQIQLVMNWIEELKATVAAGQAKQP